MIFKINIIKYIIMNDLDDKINEVKEKKNIKNKKLKNIIINEVIIEKDKNIPRIYTIVL